MKTLVNIFGAIILGLLLDNVSSYYLSFNKYLRVIIQIFSIILIVDIINNIYKNLFGANLTENSIYFISIFLGMQRTLWSDIESIFKETIFPHIQK
jgi:hypothetical protein